MSSAAGPRADRAARRNSAQVDSHDGNERHLNDPSLNNPANEGDEGDLEENEGENEGDEGEDDDENARRGAQQAAQARFDRDVAFEEQVTRHYNALRRQREMKEEREEKGQGRHGPPTPHTRRHGAGMNDFEEGLDFGRELDEQRLGSSRWGLSSPPGRGPRHPPQGSPPFGGMSFSDRSTRSSLDNMAVLVERLYEERPSSSRSAGTSAKEVRVMFALRYPNVTIGEIAPYFDSLVQIFVVFNMCERDPVKTLMVLAMITTPHSMPTHDGSSTTTLTFEQYLRFFTEKQLGTTHDIHNKMSKQLEDPSTRPAKQGTKEPSHAYEGRAKSYLAAIKITLQACGCSAAAVAQVTNDYMMCWFQGADIGTHQIATIVSSYNGKLSAGSNPDTARFLHKVVNVYEANRLMSKAPPKNDRLEDMHRNQLRHLRQRPDNRHVQRPTLALSVPDVSNAELMMRVDSNTAQLNLMQTGGPPPSAKRTYQPKKCEAHNGRHDVQDCPDKSTLCNMHGNGHKHSDCPDRPRREGICYNCGQEGHYSGECKEPCRTCRSRPHKDNCKHSSASPNHGKRDRDGAPRAPYRHHNDDARRRSPLGNGRGRGR